MQNNRTRGRVFPFVVDRVLLVCSICRKAGLPFSQSVMRGTLSWIPFATYSTLYYGLQIPVWKLSATRLVGEPGDDKKTAPPVDVDIVVRAVCGLTSSLVAGAPYALRSGANRILPVALAGTVIGCFMPSVSVLQQLQDESL